MKFNFAINKTFLFLKIAFIKYNKIIHFIKNQGNLTESREYTSCK